VVGTGLNPGALMLTTQAIATKLIRIPAGANPQPRNELGATALLLYEVARRGWMKSITGQRLQPRASSGPSCRARPPLRRQNPAAGRLRAADVDHP